LPSGARASSTARGSSLSVTSSPSIPSARVVVRDDDPGSETVETSDERGCGTNGTFERTRCRRRNALRSERLSERRCASTLSRAFACGP
jgi:hypothetical protein